MVVSAVLAQLSGIWRRRVGSAARTVVVAGLVAVLIAGAHVARIGTLPARIGVLVALLVIVLAATVRWWRDRRDWRSAERTIDRVLVASDAHQGRRARRALTLAQRTGRGEVPGSAVLAELHLQRVLERFRPAVVEASATRRARYWHALGGVLVAVTGAAVVAGPLRVLEGLDVLAARDGVAPVPISWIEYPRITAEPPAYLRRSKRLLLPGVSDSQPVGTTITVRGAPRFEGRRLVLTDGETEVPFVSDGSGRVVARWTLRSNTKLRVAARFGEVVIRDPESLELRALPDEAPQVNLFVRTDPADSLLEPAPKSLKLSEVDRIELQYTAVDDHGLEQVDLVLRTGGREDRRMLSRLDGQTKRERGGHVITSRDPFLQRAFLPVRVTVEARDNDPIESAKWGRSEAVLLLPPAVGEPEAKRYAALAAARDELIELVALRTRADAQKKNPKKRTELERKATEQQRTALAELRDALGKSYGGLSVPEGLSAFVEGQARQLERPPPAGSSVLRRSEDVLLAIDKAVRRVGNADARIVSKRLADVAEEAADAAEQARDGEDRARGMERLDAAIAALKGGASQLSTLDLLGADLGGVARADTGRIVRARKDQNMTRAELAARHLAARLRRPNPSFGSAASGGVESGAASGQPVSGEASNADDAFDQLARELEQLARDHAGAINKVQSELSNAEKTVNAEEHRDEAKRRADAIRRALKDLPLAGAEPNTPRGTAALGREHAEAMAHALEKLSLEDAVRSGKDAVAALQDAERKARNAGPMAGVDPERLARSRRELKEQLDWAQKVLQEMRSAAEREARDSMQGSAKEERELARRAGNLGVRGKMGESALPGELVDSLEKAERLMREAARALENGRSREGLEKQREAQRLLEQSDTGQTGDSSRERSGDPRERDARGRAFDNRGSVPKEADTSDDFRKRVLDGLGRQKGGSLSPAVKRYAEGLLR